MDAVILRAAGSEFTLRRAVAADVEGIVGLLADDALGAARDGGAGLDLAPYLRAFEAVEADPAQRLLVACGGDGELAGTMQVMFLPGLSRRGALRAQIEAVRVARAQRGRGLGEAMISWAVADARRRGCALVQLTSDKRRPGAHRFYERLGFTASHEGFKLQL